MQFGGMADMAAAAGGGGGGGGGDGGGDDDDAPPPENCCPGCPKRAPFQSIYFPKDKNYQNVLANLTG